MVIGVNSLRLWYSASARMAVRAETFFVVGEIRPALDSDFQHFIDLADGGGWVKKMEKNGLLAWTRNTENASIKMFKVGHLHYIVDLYYTCTEYRIRYVYEGGIPSCCFCTFYTRPLQLWTRIILHTLQERGFSY